MTREEALKILKEDGCGHCTWQSTNPYECENKECEVKEALEMAIQALSQEPICDRDCEHCTWTECPIEPCDDAISRDAVNTLVDELARAISDERCHIPQKGRDTGHIMHDILELPSVTQKPIECDDAISRDIALVKMSDYVASGYAESIKDFEEYSRIICQLPSVTQKSGKWKREEFPNFTVAWFCNKCGRGSYRKSNFCPNCGAKMVEPQESEEQTE